MLAEYYPKSKFDIYYTTLFSRGNTIKFLLYDSRLLEGEINIDSENYLEKLERSLFREKCNAESMQFYKAYDQFIVNYYRNKDKPQKIKDVVDVKKEEKKELHKANKKGKKQEILSPELQMSKIVNNEKEEQKESKDLLNNSIQKDYSIESQLQTKTTKHNEQKKNLRKNELNIDDSNKKIDNNQNNNRKQVNSYLQLVRYYYSQLNKCFVDSYQILINENGKTLKEKSQFYPNFDFHFATIPKGNEIINPPNRFSYVEKEEFKKLRKLSSLSSILGNAIEIEF